MIEHLRRLLSSMGCQDESLSDLEAAMSPQRSYVPGQEIIAQFSQPGESTLVTGGLCGRLITLPDGAQQLTALHLAGDFVDLHSFVLSRLDHSVVALTRCTVCSVQHPALKRITERHPRLTRALWALTAVDAAIHRQWLVAVGRMSAVERTAHLICELWFRHERVGLAQSGRFELGLTQAAFADALCLSKVHLNRVVQELRRMELIRWEGLSIQILDWEGLRDLSKFEPTYLQPGP